MKEDFGTKKLERIIKSFANSKRLEILHILKQEPGLSIEAISEKLRTGYFNASDHLRKMVTAGLLVKKGETLDVSYKLTALGESIWSFCKKLK